MPFSNSHETGRPLKVKDEGITVATNTESIDVTGDGAEATAIGQEVTQDFTGGGGGGGGLTPVAKTANYTAVNGDLVVADLSSNSITVTLPAATGSGAVIGVKLGTASSDRTVTVDGNGAETIDGALTVVLYVENDYIEVQDSASGEWIVIEDSLQPHVASMYNSTAESVSSGELEYDTVTFDNAGLADLTDNSFVIRRAGKYSISTYVRLSSMPDGTLVNVDVSINGTSRKVFISMSSSTSNNLPSSGEVKLNLAAGDIVTSSLFQNSGSAKNTNAAGNGQTELAISEIR